MNFLFRSLTEIDFLSRQNMVFDSGARTTTGTLATITPADGETFVLLGARISPIAFTVLINGTVRCTVELRNESNVRDILGSHGVSGAANLFAGGSAVADLSIIKGDILEGDGIKTYTLELTRISSMEVAGAIYGYIRNT